MLDQLRKDFEVGKLCKILKVSRAAFYRFKQKRVADAKPDEPSAMSRQVCAVFEAHKRRYGARRIAAVLQSQGVKVTRRKVAKILRENQLRAIQPKSYVPKTTQSGHGKRNSPNLLIGENGNRKPPPTELNRVWVSDITYLPLVGGGFGYLAIWMDLCSRLIVAWQVEDTMEERLVIEPLKRALIERQPEVGIILHSDSELAELTLEGGQYVSTVLRELMSLWSVRQSMTRPDEVHDNAFAESFFSRFKQEAMPKQGFNSVVEADRKVFEYIALYYNRERKHSALGYQSPAQFEQKFYCNSNQQLDTNLST